jgi:putative transposase
MVALFRNKYRIGSIRLKSHDYSGNGSYYITICTRRHIPFFGKIKSGKIIHSETGEIARKFWMEIPKHFPFAELDEFIIMPDHMHGIIIIDHKTNFESPVLSVEPLHATALPPPQQQTQPPQQQTQPQQQQTQPQQQQTQPQQQQTQPQQQQTQPQQQQTQPQQQQTQFMEYCHIVENKQQPQNDHFSIISPKTGSLGLIIRSYKSAVSKYAHVIDPCFNWQNSYYDHVIRTNTELNRIRKYIRENPTKWIGNSYNP